MPLIVLRLEQGLKDVIDKISRSTDRSMSDIARSLIIIGLGMRKSGGIDIFGPFSLRRPFVMVTFGGTSTNLGLHIDDDLYKELKKAFRNDAREGMREMLRLGALSLEPDKITVKGLGILERPLAKIKISKIKDLQARAEHEKLLKRLKR